MMAVLPSGKIAFDWTFNVGNLFSLIVFILAGIGAWYDVKSDTKINALQIAALQATDARYAAELKQHHDDDVAADHNQDQKRQEAINDVKGVVREQTGEIKAEIRDLRNDLIRKGAH